MYTFSEVSTGLGSRTMPQRSFNFIFAPQIPPLPFPLPQMSP